MIWSRLLDRTSCANLLVAAQVLCAADLYRRQEASSFLEAFVQECGHAIAAGRDNAADRVLLSTAIQRLTGRRPIPEQREARLRWFFAIDGDRIPFVTTGESLAYLSDATSEQTITVWLHQFVAVAPLTSPAWLWAIVSDPTTLELFTDILGSLLIALPANRQQALAPLGHPLLLLGYVTLLEQEYEKALKLLFLGLACDRSHPLSHALAVKALATGPRLSATTLCYRWGIERLASVEDC